MERETFVQPTSSPEGTIFEMVPIDKLFLDSAYGRSLSETNLNRLRSKFNVKKMGTLYGSLRSDGRIAVIDGWHRKNMAEEFGIKVLPVYVYLDLTIAQEAELYDAFGTVYAQSPLVKFRARLVAGDPIAVDIDRVVHAAGLRINFTSHTVMGINRRADEIQAVQGIEAIYKAYGRDHLARVLRTIQEWFPDQPEAMRDNVVRGINAFLVQYALDGKGKFDNERMRLHLKLGIDPILRRAASIRIDERQTMPSAIGKALRATYNNSFRRKEDPRQLSDWRNNIVSPGGKAASTDVLRNGHAPVPINERYRKHPIFHEMEIAGLPD